MGKRIDLIVGLSSVMVLAAALAGCASSGNESIADASAESVGAQLVKGKTRQAQVREMFGDPAKVTFTDSGNEIWEYEFSRLQSKPQNFIPYVNIVSSGAEGNKKSLVVFFNQAKIVQQFSLSNSKVDVSRGLIAN